MIVDALLKIAEAVVGLLVALLPPWNIEIPGLAALVAHLSRFNGWVPLTELGLQIGIIVSLAGVLVVWKLGTLLVGWIMDVIP